MSAKYDLPKLDEAQASAIMANVFAACEREPSTVPISVLASYTQYRRDRCSLQKGLVIFMLVVFMLLPLCFIAPRFDVREISRTQTGIPTLELDVRNWMPVRLVSARLDGRSVPVYESADRVYTIEPGSNGTLTLTVTLANQQYEVWSGEITGIDASAPKLDRSEYVSGNLRIYAVDDGVGVDYAAAYAVTLAGEQISPAEIGSDYVAFPYGDELNIYIPDLNGNTLQLVLTPK